MMATVIATLLVACSGEVDSPAAPSTEPVTSSAETVHTFAAADCPALDCDGPLVPGRYLADYFDPSIGFEVATPGWDWSYSGGTLALIADDYHDGLLYNSDGIYLLRDPRIASQDCEETEEPGVGGTAEELAAWLRNAPGLVASDPTHVSVGGLEGLRLDLRIDPQREQTCPFTDPVPAVPLVYRGAKVGGYHWVLVPHQTMRWYILDTDDGVIVVDIEDAPAGEPRDELLETGDAIVQTMVFSQA
jgi:hypothetical protein